jgi:hypothetical protein
VTLGREIHTKEPLVSQPSDFDVEMAIEKQKRHKFPGVDQIQAEYIQAGGRKFAPRSISLPILFGKTRIVLRSGRSPSFYRSVRKW